MSQIKISRRAIVIANTSLRLLITEGLVALIDINDRHIAMTPLSSAPAGR